MKELDNIFPNCYADIKLIWDAVKLRLCVVNKLRVSNVKIQNLQKDATFVRINAEHTSGIIIEKGTECLSKVYTAAHSKIDDAKDSAFFCIDYLQIPREEN